MSRQGGEGLTRFFHGVQVVIVLVTAGNIAAFFDLYEQHSSLAGLAIRGFSMSLASALAIALAIDLATFVVNLEAVNRVRATGRASAIWVHILVSGILATMSAVINYEMTAGVRPVEFAHVELVTVSALAVNPFIVACLPYLNTLLTFMVPSIVAAPRARSEADYQEERRRLQQDAELRELRAGANARVREAQVRGAMATVGAAADSAGLGGLLKRFAPQEEVLSAPSASPAASGSPRDSGPDDDGSDPSSSLSRGAAPHWSESELPGGLGSSSPITLEVSLAQKRAMLNSASATKRVGQTGVIGVNDLTELLGCSASQAGTILRASGIAHRLGESRTAPSVASASQLTAWLVRHDSPAYREHGRKLEAALKLGSRAVRRRHAGELVADGAVSRFPLDRETNPQLAVVGSPAHRGATARTAGQANVIPFTPDRGTRA